jgi:hypothetical protein
LMLVRILLWCAIASSACCRTPPVASPRLVLAPPCLDRPPPIPAVVSGEGHIDPGTNQTGCHGDALAAGGPIGLCLTEAALVELEQWVRVYVTSVERYARDAWTTCSGPAPGAAATSSSGVSAARPSSATAPTANAPGD